MLKLLISQILDYDPFLVKNYLIFIAVSAYKFSKGLAPKYMDNVFKRSSSLHQRHTRYSDESKLNTPHRKHDYRKICPSYRGATIWNSLEILLKKQNLVILSSTWSRLDFSEIWNSKRKISTSFDYFFSITFLLLIFFLRCSVKIIGFNVTFLLFCLLYANSFWRGPLWKYNNLSSERPF